MQVHNLALHVLLLCRHYMCVVFFCTFCYPGLGNIPGQSFVLSWPVWLALLPICMTLCSTAAASDTRFTLAGMHLVWCLWIS